jgi:hypothetical protein
MVMNKVPTKARRYGDFGSVTVYRAEEVKISVFSLVPTYTFLQKAFAVLCYCSQLHALSDRKMCDLVVEDIYLSVEVREVSKATITRDQCAADVPDIHSRVRGTRIRTEVQIFTSSPTVFTRVIYKALEHFDTLFTTERQYRIYHFCLLFTWE